MVRVTALLPILLGDNHGSGTSTSATAIAWLTFARFMHVQRGHSLQILGASVRHIDKQANGCSQKAGPAKHSFAALGRLPLALSASSKWDSCWFAFRHGGRVRVAAAT